MTQLPTPKSQVERDRPPLPQTPPPTNKGPISINVWITSEKLSHIQGLIEGFGVGKYERKAYTLSFSSLCEQSIQCICRLLGKDKCGEVGAVEEFVSWSHIIGQNHLFSLQYLGLHPSPHQLAPPCHVLRLCPPMN